VTNILKTAVAQISCAVGDMAANVRKLRDFSVRAEAAGAELIVFPEMADTGYSMPAIQQHASSWREGAVPALREIAAQLGIAIISGVSEREESLIYNTQIVINAAGEVVAKYRKTHLFTPAPTEEHKCFTGGDELAVVTMGPLRLGLSICYDLRFPELYRSLASDDGVNTFVISSAWPFPRVEHLRTLAMARAIENQSYCVLANRVGTDNRTTFCGASAIIDPYGTVIAAASPDREELIYGDLSLGVLQAVRERMPVLSHRRPELYRSR